MTDVTVSSSTFSGCVRAHLRGWRRRVWPAFLQKKNVVVMKGPFESVLGEETPCRYLPYRELEDEPPWYRSDEDLSLVLTDRVKEFYRQYPGLETSQLEARLCEIRRQAWSLGNYPTFGSWYFTRDTLRAHPFYPELVSKLKGGARLLEVGPGLGQDLRYLAHDGAPTDRVLAVDCRLDLWKLGYTLFDDSQYVQQQDVVSPDYRRANFRARFIEANLVSRTFTDRYKKLHGTFDIIMANNFFNNAVEWTTTKWALRHLEPFTKVGTLFLGYHIAPAIEFVYTKEDMSYFDHFALQRDVFDKGSSNFGPDKCRWVTESYTTVDLEEWGLEERHWNWIKDCKYPDQVQEMRGAYYVMRRVQ